MNRNRSTNNRGGRNSVSRPLNASLGALKSSLHGHANKLTATNPPPFTRKPFNTITVESIQPIAVDASVTIENIVAALKAQLGNKTVPLDSPVTIKIKRIDLWAIGGLEVVPTVRASFYGLSPQISSQQTAQIYVSPQKSLEDIGTPGASAAVVSYSYPRDQSDIPLSPHVFGTSSIPVFSLTIQENTVCYMRFHLLWNTADSLLVNIPAPAA